MKYSTTKAIVNLVRPGTFQNGFQGFGATGLGTGVSLSTNMMLGLALGSLGVVLWCKHSHKLARSSA